MTDAAPEDWSERGPVEDAKALRSGMADPKLVAGLVQRSPFKLFGALTLDYLSIAVAATLSEHYLHPAVYCLAVIWIGGRQIGIGSVGLHEGAHRLLLRNRRLNDGLARALLWSIFAPAFTLSLAGFRNTHFEHHREVNSPRDPDLPVTQYVCGSRKSALLLLLAGLSGLFGVYLFSLYLRAGGWRRRILALLVVGGVTTGAVLGLRPVQLFLLYYLVPALTWGMFINQLRTMAEHYPRDQFGPDAGVPDVLLTRDVLPSLFDRLFVTTRAVNYHLSHHLFPAVPFYNLARLQRHLAKNDAYRARAHLTYGYHRFLIELLTKKRPALERAAPVAS